MDKNEIRSFIIDRLQDKMLVFDIRESELKDGFDLVKSGLLDSMAFVDLVAEVEEEFGIELDFEEATELPDFTTMGGLAKMIIAAENE